MRFKFYALKLCGFIFLVFLAQLFISGFNEFFILNSLAWSQLWRFFSSMFLHASLAHLIYNLFALALFGSILESIIGGRKFLLIFFLTGILANLIAVNFYDNSLGASGAIFGVIGTIIAIRPLLIVWAFGLPMPIFIAGILWGLGDFIGAYGFFSGASIDNVGNIAHLSGMFFGFIFGILLRKSRIKKRKRKTEINERSIRRWEDEYLR